MAWLRACLKCFNSQRPVAKGPHLPVRIMLGDTHALDPTSSSRRSVLVRSGVAGERQQRGSKFSSPSLCSFVGKINVLLSPLLCRAIISFNYTFAQTFCASTASFTATQQTGSRDLKADKVEIFSVNV